MLNRIPLIDPKGGVFGGGRIIGEWDVDPDFGALITHFKNDPILPGILMTEGINQTLNFLFYYAGFENLYNENTKDVQIRAVNKETSYAAFRGQVSRKKQCSDMKSISRKLSLQM